MTTRIILLVGSMLLAGCTSLTRDQASVLRDAAKAYDLATKSATRQEIFEMLGAPSSQSGDVYTWKTSVTKGNFESIEASFSADGRVTKFKRVSNRFTSSTWTLSDKASVAAPSLATAQ